MTIFKYLISEESTILHLPKDANIIHVAYLRNDIFVWAELDPSEEHIKRKIEVFGTGENYDKSIHRRHLGTVITGSSLVLHVFEVLNYQQ